ncbi:hypothetical protein [Gemmatimonas aurantiaca]
MNGMAQDVWSYIVAAYTITWVVLAGYAWYLWRIARAAHAADTASAR